MRNTAIRRGAYILGVVLLGAYAAVVLNGPQGFTALRETRNKVKEQQILIDAMRHENEYKRERIEKLKRSASEQEMVIRQNLHKLRPGEMSFILPQGSKTTAP